MTVQQAAAHLAVEAFGDFRAFARRQHPECLLVGVARQRPAAGFRQHGQLAARATAHNLLVAPFAALFERVPSAGRRFDGLDVPSVRVASAPVPDHFFGDPVVFPGLFIRCIRRIFEEDGRISEHINKSVPAVQGVGLGTNGKHGGQVHRTQAFADDQAAFIHGFQLGA